MLELKNPIPKPNRRLLAASPVREAEERKQRRLMVIALLLLLVALGFVLYRDRDFWFPETQEAEDQPSPALPAATSNSTQSPVRLPASSTTTKKSRAKNKAKASSPVATA